MYQVSDKMEHAHIIVPYYFIVLKLVFKALHDKNWPSYLALENREVGKYNLRSMGATTLKVPLVDQ